MIKISRTDDAQQVFDRLVNTNSLITGYIKCGKLHDGLALYKKLGKDDSVCITGHTYVALLRACTMLKDFNKGVEIHADISKRGLLMTDLFVTNTLVDMYTKCGSLSKAQNLLDELSLRDVVSWTTLITGYTDYGHGEEAVRCFDRMRLEGVSPNNVTFVCSLKACGIIGETRKGQELHVEIEGNGFLEKDVTAGNALVNMYCKHGLVEKAAKVFNRLSTRDVVSWTALIAGCVEYGDSMKALEYFEEMKAAGVSPNAHTFASCLKACGHISAIDKVDEIYSQINMKRILERDIVLGNTLVDIYAKCGFLEKAKVIFNELSVRNVITWTSLISGYSDHGHDEQAITCFEQMQLEGIFPDALTFVCILKCCGTLKIINKGCQIHIEIERRGILYKDVFVGNAMVNMYMKCGSLTKAQEVFDVLPIRGVTSWTTFITGYLDQGKSVEPLKYFDCMQAEGVLSSTLTLVYILKACGNVYAIDKGQEIHAEVEKRALLQEDLNIGNNLVDMYIKCGLFMEALQAFDTLPARNSVSWNALISGYVEQDNSEEAVKYFKLMQLEGVLPNTLSFVWTLKACGNIGAIDKSHEIHIEIEKKGLSEANISIGNTLIDMYAKCGFLHEAWKTFDSIQVRDTVSWNVLITGYVEYGYNEAAIMCFEHMQLDGVPPDSVSYICSIKACANIGDIKKGQNIHSDIDKMGPLGRDPVVRNALINMYAKFGFIEKAEEIFGDTFDRNVISWTTIIKGYVECGHCEQALRCFEQMQCEGISPNAITFISILKACESIEAIVRGKEVHCQIGSIGNFEGDFSIIGNELVHMYAMCGFLEEAWNLVDKVWARDVSLWTSLIMGYVEHGHGDKAMECFDLMHLEGISPDAFTLVSILKACGITGALNKGQNIHMDIERMGLLDRDIIASNAVMGMYAKCGILTVAHEIFDKLPIYRDVVSWNVLITGYAEHGHGEKALECVEQMQLEGMFPNAVTYLGSLKACGDIKSSKKCGEIHAILNQRDILGTDHLISNTLVDTYFEFGMFSKVEEVFIKLPIRNVVSWTALIAGHVKHGHGEEALKSFERMQLEHVCPNLVTFICSLQACSNLGVIRKGQEIHSEIEKKGLLSQRCTGMVGNTLIDMYAKCGWLGEAFKVLEKAQVGDIVSWNALLTGYSQLGENGKVLHLFRKILGQGVRPSDVTFLIVLNACGRVGLFYNSHMYLEVMTKEYGIAPTLKHITGMIYLLCRKGDIHNAIQMAKKLPFCANLVVWHSILSVCRDCGNVALGKDAFESAMKVNQNDAS